MSFQKQGIPSDWRVQTLADLGATVTSGSRGWAKYYAEHGSLFVRITNLNRSNIHLDLRDRRFVQVDSHDAEARRTRLVPGDLLISITADIGIISYVDEKTPDPAYINQHIARVRLDPRLVSSRFVAYYLASWEPQRRFIGSTDQGAKAGMNLATVAALPTLVPPRAEQSRIADALTDIDELIAALQRLIAKKQAIKEGMMQQLLTGRTRLYGFTEPWKECSLGELCDVITDGTHFTPTYVSRGIPFYSVESVTNDDFVNVKYISPEEHRVLVRRCRPQRGDILMTRIGSLGETKYLDWSVSASIYVSLALLRPGRGIDGRYLYAFTKSRRFVRAVEDHSLLWAAPKKINMGDIYHVPVLLPSDLDEQRAIADVVFELEDQLKTAERLVIKTQAIKQAMMQQLLTGRTRLPVQEPAA